MGGEGETCDCRFCLFHFSGGSHKTQTDRLFPESKNPG